MRMLDLAQEQVRDHPVADAGDQRGVDQQHEIGCEVLRAERLVARDGDGQIADREQERGDDHRHQRRGKEDRDTERDQVVGKTKSLSCRR